MSRHTRKIAAAVGAGVLALFGVGTAVVMAAPSNVTDGCGPIVTQSNGAKVSSCTIAPGTVTATVTATKTVSKSTVTVTAPAPTPTSSAPTSATPSATPSSTPTPTPSTTAPSTGFPDATNTGVPAGTTLTTSGGLNINTAGTVINGLDINGCVAVNAPNVTIKNSRIRGTCTYVVGSFSSGLLIQDSEIDGLNSSGASVGLGYAGFTAVRVNIHGSQDGVNANGNATLQDSYVHDLHDPGDCHCDGVQVTQGSNIKLLHNTILNNMSETSAIMIGADQGNVSAVTIDGNLLAGGGYTLYGGDVPPAGRSVTNISITNNQFSTRFFPRSGSGGATAYIISGQPYSNNVYADGPNAGQQV